MEEENFVLFAKILT